MIKTGQYVPKYNKRSMPVALNYMLIVALLTLSYTGCKKPEQTDPGSEIYVSTFSVDFQNLCEHLDIEYSKKIMEEMSSLGDDPATGFRTAGSSAEQGAADVILREMNLIGLTNVTSEHAPVSGWTYGGASLEYEDVKGYKQKIVLGGYPVSVKAENEQLAVVDLGRGTVSDYSDKDIMGKLILIDVNPSDWNVSCPAYQALLKGARGVLAHTLTTASEDDTLITQRLYSPSDFPVFAISGADSLALRNEIRLGRQGEIEVQFNADSTVNEADTLNVWGDIVGKTDDKIYVIGNYDGFYRADFYDASGMSTVLGIAKAMIDSGYEPVKTIRFVAFGAGEWGAKESIWSKGAGAMSMLTQIHPEWVSSAFAVLAVDGAQPVSNSTQFGMNVSDDISEFVIQSADELIDTSHYSYIWRLNSKRSGAASLGDIWELSGVSTISAASAYPDPEARFNGIPEFSEAEYTELLSESFYHSNKDTIENQGFNPDAYLFNHQLFGKMLIDLDQALIKPLFIDSFVENLNDSYSVRTSALNENIAEASRLALLLSETIEEMNSEYLEAFETEKESMEVISAGLNRELFKLQQRLRLAFLRPDKGGQPVWSHATVQANIDILNETKFALQSDETQLAISILSSMDTGRYGAWFDEETCDYLAEIVDTGGMFAALYAEDMFSAETAPFLIESETETYSGASMPEIAETAPLLFDSNAETDSGANIPETENQAAADSELTLEADSAAAFSIKPMNDPGGYLADYIPPLGLLPLCRADRLVRSLTMAMEKSETDYSKQLTELDILIAIEEGFLREIYVNEVKALSDAATMMCIILDDYFNIAAAE